ncbi:MAG: hypothetical protein M1825_001102 [Sarcosagium campestre]|nr:MAG: hypothetical protein M1825_001102 [Sarcosagium campestre]
MIIRSRLCASSARQSRGLEFSIKAKPTDRPSTRSSSRVSRASTKSSGSVHEEDIAKILSTPSWSVRSLLPDQDGPRAPREVSSKELRHLLRLSALPPPSSPEAEEKMLDTLTSQLHFVKEIQTIDTTDVEPLGSLRDETAQAAREEAITLDSVRDALETEELVGPFKRPRRRKDLPVETNGAEDWDPLTLPKKKSGRFFIVQRGAQDSQ